MKIHINHNDHVRAGMNGSLYYTQTNATSPKHNYRAPLLNAGRIHD